MQWIERKGWRAVLVLGVATLLTAAGSLLVADTPEPAETGPRVSRTFLASIVTTFGGV